MGLESGLSVMSLGAKTNQGSHIVYITEKAAHQHAQNVTYGLVVAACLFRLTG